MLVRLKCKKCGYEWFPRVDNPKACPRCHSPYWDKEKRGDKESK